VIDRRRRSRAQDDADSHQAQRAKQRADHRHFALPQTVSLFVRHTIDRAGAAPHLNVATQEVIK
jgi:hypothetical protein